MTLAPPDARPLFSIVIPTYNRPGPLATCLDAIARLDYPRDRFEVLVVDDGGRASPAAVVDEFRSRIAVALIRQEHGGPAKARNTGARRAAGDVLVFIDDDCLVAPDLLRRLASHHAAAPDVGIGGHTVNALKHNVYSTATQQLIDYLYGYFNTADTGPRFFCANNLALPAEMFRRVGGFDEAMTTGEDREICERWRSHGYGLRYCPDVRIGHAHALTLTSFCRQHFNYGRGSFRFHRAGAGRQGRRVRLEGGSFYLNLVRHRVPGSRGGRAVALRLLLALSQLATATGFACEWARASIRRRRGEASAAHGAPPGPVRPPARAAAVVESESTSASPRRGEDR